MYRGNMQDFVDKVNTYLDKWYDCMLILVKKDKYNCIAFFAPDQAGALGYEVYDKEDFEQQIYDYVNRELEDNELCIKETNGTS